MMEGSLGLGQEEVGRSTCLWHRDRRTAQIMSPQDRTKARNTNTATASARRYAYERRQEDQYTEERLGGQVDQETMPNREVGKSKHFAVDLQNMH